MLLHEEVQGLFSSFNEKACAAGHLDAKTKDLIAISNSVLVDCIPCVEYHYRQAIQKGATVGEVKEAIAVAIAVAGGNKIAKFSDTLHRLEHEDAK